MCPVFNADMSEENGCPLFTTELKLCEVCGSHIFKGAIIAEDDGTYHMTCPQCGTNLNQCATCIQQSQCAFQSDQSCPEPPYVMVQQRQGNAIIQTQRLNPKRIQATCAQGCPCFNEDGLDDNLFCLSAVGCGCKNYKTNWRNMI
jgi:hypothetical protein